MKRPQYPEVVGDRKLIRFIRGHGHDEEKILEMVEKFLDWRDANEVDKIRENIVNGMNHWLKFPKGELITGLIDTVVIAPYAVDKEGSPICVDQYNFSPSEVLEKITLEEYVHYTIYTLEYRSMILEYLSEMQERKEISQREREGEHGARRLQDYNENGIEEETTGVLIRTCVIRDMGCIGFEHIGKQGQVLFYSPHPLLSYLLLLLLFLLTSTATITGAMVLMRRHSTMD